MSFSAVRRSVALVVAVVGAAGLVGCSGGSSSSAQASASPGSVPQVGQVVATAELSEGGYAASRCSGVEDVARESLASDAYEHGWVVDHFSADDDGCWSAGGMTVRGQAVSLAVEADQDASTASLRVVDVAPSASASSST